MDNNENGTNNTENNENGQKENTGSSYTNNSYGYGYNGYNGFYQQNNGFSPKPNQDKERSPKNYAVLAIVLSLVISITVSVFGGVLGGIAMSSINKTTTSDTKTVAPIEIKTNMIELDPSLAGTPAEVAANCMPSVVSITTYAKDTGGNEYQLGSGSGVIVSSDGHIVTCEHVTSSATKIVVTTADKTEYTAKLIGSDSWTDIAVIAIEGGYTNFPYKNLTVPAEGKDYLCVGEEVLVIGNPLGDLPGSVSNGIISGLNREITIDGVKYTVIQHTAAVNPGNSGGGLFDMYGNFIGIINAKSVSTDVEGIAYAIPSDSAVNIVEQLCNQGYVNDRPWIGITYQGPRTVHIGYGMYFTGYVIQEYIFGDELKYGDIICSIDGESITSSNQIRTILSDKSVGDDIEFEVISLDGEGNYSVNTHKVTITVHSSQEYYAKINENK